MVFLWQPTLGEDFKIPQLLPMNPRGPQTPTIPEFEGDAPQGPIFRCENVSFKGGELVREGCVRTCSIYIYIHISYILYSICIEKSVSTQNSHTWILIMIMKHSWELVVKSSIAKINPCFFFKSLQTAARQPNRSSYFSSAIQQFPTSTKWPGMRRPSPLAEWSWLQVFFCFKNFAL